MKRCCQNQKRQGQYIQLLSPALFPVRTSMTSPILQTIFIGGIMEKMDQRTRSTPNISSSNGYLPSTTITHGGCPCSGQTKIKVTERIASLLNTYGLRREITSQTVYNKIAHIEGQMRSIYDWCSGSKTGVGLNESDPLSLNQKVSSSLFAFLIT